MERNKLKRTRWRLEVILFKYENRKPLDTGLFSFTFTLLKINSKALFHYHRELWRPDEEGHVYIQWLFKWSKLWDGE